MGTESEKTRTQSHLKELSVQKRNVNMQRSMFMGDICDKRVEKEEVAAPERRIQEGFSEEVTFKPDLESEQTMV